MPRPRSTPVIVKVLPSESMVTSRLVAENNGTPLKSFVAALVM